MKITEVVDQVKRNKLPRDPVWLTNRIKLLASQARTILTHFKTMEEDHKLWANSQVPNAATAGLTPASAAKILGDTNYIDLQPVDQATDNLASRHLTKEVVSALRLLDGAKGVRVYIKYPDAETMAEYARRYDRLKEDLERTVRSYGRMVTKS